MCVWFEYESFLCFYAARPTSCGQNEYVCVGGGCVSASQRCDGQNDCSDGSDEVSWVHTLNLHSVSAVLVNTAEVNGVQII